jgi:hypothetical protein
MSKRPEENLGHLEAESRREGLRPEAKVIEPIARDSKADLDGFSEALARLRELRAGMPPVDAVEIVRAGRRELEDRFAL